MSGEPTQQIQVPITPDLFSNDQTAYDYFVAKGLTSFQSAGIVGNLDQESGVDPGAVQAGGPGRGIAQWSVGGRWDTDSNDNAVWYAGKEGLSVTSLQLQLDFIWYELTTFSSYGLAALQATTNVTDATVTFETDFEGCGQCDQSTRISYAQGVLSAYGAPPPYAAQFVSQSFPLATTTLTMVEGQVIPSYIELKNTGAKTWDSSTRIGTTQPRDRVSVFADSTWVADNRPAGVEGTVAPGATYKFTFNLTAPAKAGTYDEFFGVVQEGVAWFSDSGQGGPPDNDLEVKITVVAPEKADGAAPDADADVDAGAHADADASGSDGGDGVPVGGHDAGSGLAAGEAAGDAGWATGPDGKPAGCSLGVPVGDAGSPGRLVIAALAVLSGCRRRRRARAARHSSAAASARA